MSIIKDTYLYRTLNSYYGKPLPMAGGIVCGAVALEATIRVIGNFLSLCDKANVNGNKALKKDISENLGKALLYGLCATNKVPGTAFIGAVIFACRSLLSKDAKTDREYLTSKCIRVPITGVIDTVVTPLTQKLVVPTLGFGNALAEGLFKIVSLKPHRTWLGVAAFAPAYYFNPSCDL